MQENLQKRAQLEKSRRWILAGTAAAIIVALLITIAILDSQLEAAALRSDQVLLSITQELQSELVFALRSYNGIYSTGADVDGAPVRTRGKKVYIALNKPVGIVCTADPREKANIVDFIGHKERIYPIGRLDKDSEGLILLTSDGDIVNKILRAAGKHEKEYEVEVDKPITGEFLRAMESGVPILDTVTLPCKIRKTGERRFTLILVQGLNRQIRRMCEYLGYRVVRLKRVEDV